VTGLAPNDPQVPLVLVAECCQGCDCRSHEGLDGDHDVDIEDGLGREAHDDGTPDVLDLDVRCQGDSEVSRKFLKCPFPGGVVVHDDRRRLDVGRLRRQQRVALPSRPRPYTAPPLPVVRRAARLSAVPL